MEMGAQPSFSKHKCELSCKGHQTGNGLRVSFREICFRLSPNSHVSSCKQTSALLPIERSPPIRRHDRTDRTLPNSYNANSGKSSGGIGTQAFIMAMQPNAQKG